MEFGPDDSVDRDLPVAPWKQLAQILRARINRGDWRRKIPSQNELAALYGLSRPTVGRALDVLKDEGRLTAESGLGTFIPSEPPPEGEDEGGDSPEAPGPSR